MYVAGTVVEVRFEFSRIFVVFCGRKKKKEMQTKL